MNVMLRLQAGRTRHAGAIGHLQGAQVFEQAERAEVARHHAVRGELQRLQPCAIQEPLSQQSFPELQKLLTLTPPVQA